MQAFEVDPQEHFLICTTSKFLDPTSLNEHCELSIIDDSLSDALEFVLLLLLLQPYKSRRSVVPHLLDVYFGEGQLFP